MLGELLTVAAGQQGRWEFAAARDTLRAALDRGGQPGEVATARRMLAEVLRELGDDDAAYDLAYAAVRECRRHLGKVHPATVRATALLGAIIHDRGDLDLAEETYREVIESGLAAGDPAGPTGRAVALARANLALLTRDRGDPERARDQLAAAYAAFRRACRAG
ncbi:tetratricopeptide repeat protein [Luedemannella flava]